MVAARATVLSETQLPSSNTLNAAAKFLSLLRPFASFPLLLLLVVKLVHSSDVLSSTKAVIVFLCCLCVPSLGRVARDLSLCRNAVLLVAFVLVLARMHVQVWSSLPKVTTLPLNFIPFSILLKPPVTSSHVTSRLLFVALVFVVQVFSRLLFLALCLTRQSSFFPSSLVQGCLAKNQKVRSLCLYLFYAVGIRFFSCCIVVRSQQSVSQSVSQV